MGAEGGPQRFVRGSRSQKGCKTYLNKLFIMLKIYHIGLFYKLKYKCSIFYNVYNG